MSNLPRTRRTIVGSGLALATLLLSACVTTSHGETVQLSEPLSGEVNPNTVLRIGDPRTQAVLEASGKINELEFTAEWANIDGGPKTLEAFRADALDVGAVADIPPLFATWTGEDVRVVAARQTVDALEHPTYELGLAPGVEVDDLSDLAGKKIAYSPGQAQGALVLRVLEEARLSQDDVELVELQSTDDVFANSLGSGQVDVAPLSIAQAKSYLARYGGDGASTIPPGVPDDPWHLYAPVETVADPEKAAALRQYVEVWNEAAKWVNENPEAFAQAYYVETQGLSEEDANFVVREQGTFEIPQNWDNLIVEHQATADLLSREQGHPSIIVEEIYDRRFEPVNLDSHTATENGE